MEQNPYVYFASNFVGDHRARVHLEPDKCLTAIYSIFLLLEFKVRINSLVATAQKVPKDGWTMQDGTPWPGNDVRDHTGMIQDEESKQYTGDGSVDFKGRPVLKQNTDNWKACPFILGNECCERLAYYGIAKNLVTYLTRKLHEGNVSAARNVTTWQGTCYLTPLIGAILADSYWGRYWTIAAFSAIYFIVIITNY